MKLNRKILSYIIIIMSIIILRINKGWLKNTSVQSFSMTTSLNLSRNLPWKALFLMYIYKILYRHYTPRHGTNYANATSRVKERSMRISVTRPWQKGPIMRHGMGSDAVKKKKKASPLIKNGSEYECWMDSGDIETERSPRMRLTSTPSPPKTRFSVKTLQNLPVKDGVACTVNSEESILRSSAFTLNAAQQDEAFMEGASGELLNAGSDVDAWHVKIATSILVKS